MTREEAKAIVNTLTHEQLYALITLLESTEEEEERCSKE